MFKYYKKMLNFYIDLLAADIFRTKKKVNHKTLAIVYYGLLGDYVLFHDFLKEISQSKKYKDYQIVLIGNIIWKQLSESLDINYINKFIWIDHRKLDKSRLYRWLTLIKLSRLPVFDELIMPLDSRTVRHDDLLAYALNSKIKTTIKSCNRNIEGKPYEIKQRHIADSWYDVIKPLQYDDVTFEYEINKKIFKELVNEEYHSQKPELKIPDNIKINITLPSNPYVIFAIGGSTPQKQWSINNFKQLAIFLLEKTNYNIMICGDSKDAIHSKKLRETIGISYKDRIIDFCGKTNLFDFIYLLKYSKILISGDTSAVHFAAALSADGANNDIFVIYPLEYYSRFVPYPKNIYRKYYVCAHPKMIEKHNLFSEIKSLPINEINPEDVIKLISKVCSI